MHWQLLRTSIYRYPVVFASAALLLFSLGIYARALQHDFVWDDKGIIGEFSNIPSFFMAPLVLGDDTPDISDSVDSGKVRYYRPLLSTLHTIEYRWFGLNPLGYKIINLLLNGAVVLCAYLLVRALTGEDLLAFLAAFLYAANPARGEVVYWIYSDSHLFAALFFLLALLAYHRGRTVLALVGVTLGLLFQESVVLFPVVLVVYHITIASTRDWKWQRFAPFVALVATYLLIRQQVSGALPISDLTILDRFRGMVYLSVKHVQIFFVSDAPVTMYLYLPGMFSEEGVVTLVTYILAGMLFLLGACLFWLRRAWFFWFAWFFIFISLSFNVGGYANYLMAEKSLYLASLGPCVLIAALVLRVKRYQWACLLLLLALIGYHAKSTIERGRYWTDTVTYLEKMLEFEPDYPVANYQLGVDYLRLERYADAAHQFDVVLSLRPSIRQRIVALQASNYEQWGRSLAERGDLDGALTALHRARQLSPGQSSVYNGLGVVHFLRGERSQAVENWQMALRLDPNNAEARSNLKMFSESERKKIM